MRHVNPARQRCSSHSQRGLTLIELMVGLTIGAFLMLSAGPYFADYTANSKLREGGNLLYSEALLAQSEAVKRNATVRLSTSGATIQLIDRSVPTAPQVLRERLLSGGVVAPTATIDFGSSGFPASFAAGSIDLSMGGVTCSADYRCPGLRVAGGGAVRLCANQLASCP